ncbi:hypothetical protein QLQ85_15865 [Halomonas sp. M4R5S39]|uniref:DUF6602 domain-containing protein n=1 Tax=Halomonas kalidii TaxID=3043293 RepID=UPI0024A9AB83|nr:DUF6602 domain-containing protein [Halomonas kalidii]MDI5986270.1 hypothetical protein [Halomonas kalidii]
MKKRPKEEQEIVDLQQPSGKCIIVEDKKTGLLQRLYWNDDNFLADRFHRKIQSETEWFENVIKHAPTVGTFYENLVRNTLREFAPTNNKVGTGFVYDSSRDKHGKQIDVLVYDDSDRSVVYRCDDFVVINPGSTISAIEVKKTLNSTNLKEVVRTTFYNNLGWSNRKCQGINTINIFAFSLSCKKETIVNALKEVLEDCVLSLTVKTDGKYGKIPITYCTLPGVYFLDEGFYIQTQVTEKDDGFGLEIHSIPSPGTGSVGAFLSNVIQENREKINNNEKNYLYRNIRPCPERCNVNGSILLIDIFPFYELVDAYPDSRQELLSLSFKGMKPLSVFVPKGLHFQFYGSAKEFFNTSGSAIEFFNEERPVMMPCSEIEI